MLNESNSFDLPMLEPTSHMCNNQWRATAVLGQQCVMYFCTETLERVSEYYLRYNFVRKSAASDFEGEIGLQSKFHK